MSMNRRVISCAAGFFVILLCVWAISAEDAAKPAPVGECTKIAILNVNKVFKEHSSFKEEMAKLKKEADEMDKNMKEQQAAIQLMENELKDKTIGSQEYMELQGRIAKSRTDWTIDVQNQRGLFIQREANLYRLTYLEIEGIIEKYSREHQFDMVLRIQTDAMDSNKPDSILSYINKPIVWHNGKMDITPAILQLIAEKHKQSPKEEKTAPQKENGKEKNA
jgi:Skp family chaperone for outer membrane proteins